jgi:exodeoxyribonuclease VII small subunit
MPDQQDTPQNFEKSLQQLENIIKSMESGKLSLEDSLQNYENGIKLIRDCQTTLEQAQQRIKILQPNNQLDDM